MMINGILVGLCIGLAIIAILCAFLAIFAYAKVVGFENSTHQIEYRDPSLGLNDEDDSPEENFNPFGNSEEEPKPIDPFEKEDLKKSKVKEERLLKEALVGQDDDEMIS